MLCFVFSKKKKRTVQVARHYLTNPQPRPIFCCHLLHRCPPHLHLHVFTPSTATSSHEASFWLANAWRPFLKREKNRCMILSVLKRTCCQVLTKALQICRSIAVLKDLVVVAMRHRSCISMMNNHWKGDKLSEKRLCSVETQLACITWPGTWMRIIMSCKYFHRPLFWKSAICRS